MAESADNHQLTNQKQQYYVAVFFSTLKWRCMPPGQDIISKEDYRYFTWNNFDMIWNAWQNNYANYVLSDQSFSYLRVGGILCFVSKSMSYLWQIYLGYIGKRGWYTNKQIVGVLFHIDIYMHGGFSGMKIKYGKRFGTKFSKSMRQRSQSLQQKHCYFILN
jgi:hypothetical protein